MKFLRRLAILSLFFSIGFSLCAAPKVLTIKDFEILQNHCVDYYRLRSSDKQKSQGQLAAYLELADKLFSSEPISQNYPLHVRSESLFFVNFIQQSQGYKELLSSSSKYQKIADRINARLKTTKLTSPVFADSFFYAVYAESPGASHFSAEILAVKDNLPFLVYQSLQNTQVFMKKQNQQSGTIDGSIVDKPDVLFGLICHDDTLPVFNALVSQLNTASAPAVDQNYLSDLAKNAEVPCLFYGLPLRNIPGRFLSEHSKLFYQTWSILQWFVTLSQKYGIPLDSTFSPSELAWIHLAADNPLVLYARTDSQLLEIKKQLHTIAQLTSWYGKRIHGIMYPKRLGSTNEQH